MGLCKIQFLMRNFMLNKMQEKNSYVSERKKKINRKNEIANIARTSPNVFAFFFSEIFIMGLCKIQFLMRNFMLNKMQEKNSYVSERKKKLNKKNEIANIA